MVLVGGGGRLEACTQVQLHNKTHDAQAMCGTLYAPRRGEVSLSQASTRLLER